MWRALYKLGHYSVICILSLSANSCGPQSQDSAASIQSVPTSLELFAEVRRDPELGTIIFAKNPNLAQSLDRDNVYQELMNRRAYDGMAAYFLRKFRQDLLIDDPDQEFVLARIEEDSLGYHQVRFRQVFKNLSVIDSELIVHFNDNGNLYLVNGHYAPTPTLTEFRPAISIAAAKEKIIENLGANVTVDAPTLAIFQSPDGPLVLAYDVTVSLGLVEGWRIILDAVTGDILRKTPTRYNRN